VKAARELFLPGAAAPHWLSTAPPQGGLLYLAWGRRRYGRRPIPLRLHHGWTYMVVLEGRPTFLAGARTLPAGRGTIIVAGPDVPYGWTDKLSGSCSLLVWIWVEPPGFEARLGERACWLRQANAETLEDLTGLHRRTRREIQHPDAQSGQMLRALRGELDVTLARVGAGSDVGAREHQRLRMAEEWMRRHLEIRAPAAALADYLGLSAMGLQRLFRRATGLPPGKAFLQLKMGEARKMLQRPGASIKEVALSLGYRHPGDFSRAFRQHHGFPPSGHGVNAAGRRR
jgi:AraC-like DNA-binding protein